MEPNGSRIGWRSSDVTYISDQGKLLRRAPRSGGCVKVQMTATVTAGAEQRTRTFPVVIAREEPKFNGYLFAYFEGSGPKDNQEQLRFGVSADAVHWTALNNNQPSR